MSAATATTTTINSNANTPVPAAAEQQQAAASAQATESGPVDTATLITAYKKNYDPVAVQTLLEDDRFRPDRVMVAHMLRKDLEARLPPASPAAFQSSGDRDLFGAYFGLDSYLRGAREVASDYLNSLQGVDKGWIDTMHSALGEVPPLLCTVLAGRQTLAIANARLRDEELQRRHAATGAGSPLYAKVQELEERVRLLQAAQTDESQYVFGKGTKRARPGELADSDAARAESLAAQAARDDPMSGVVATQQQQQQHQPTVQTVGATAAAVPRTTNSGSQASNSHNFYDRLLANASRPAGAQRTAGAAAGAQPREEAESDAAKLIRLATGMASEMKTEIVRGVDPHSAWARQQQHLAGASRV